MRHFIFLLSISLIVLSCGQNNNKEKELELKEKELALKQQELDLKKQELALGDSSKNETAIKPVQANTLPTPTPAPSPTYKVILKNEVTDANGSKHADIYFNISGVDYLVQKEEWINNWKEFQNKKNEIIGCSVGKVGTMEGYSEYWIEKSKGYLLIKGYTVGGSAQVENEELIKKIKL